MKFDLYLQMSPKDRAYHLLNKYSFDYIKVVVNGIITQSRKNSETYVCNYWNEVATEIKKIMHR